MMMIMYETVGNFHLLGFSARQGLENSGVICSLNRKCVIVRSQANFEILNGASAAEICFIFTAFYFWLDEDESFNGIFAWRTV